MKIKAYILTFFILLSGIVFGQDTLLVKDFQKKDEYVNEYVIKQNEKDSIFNVVFSDDKTQQLLKSYTSENNEDILLVENQFNLVSILISDLTDFETKKSLLINKIKFDQKRPLFIVADYRVYPLEKQKIRKINSKEWAITDFIKSYNDERFVNFSGMLMVFSKKNKKIKVKDEIIAIDKKIDRIQKTKIKKLHFFIMPESTALYSKQGIYGVLIID